MLFCCKRLYEKYGIEKEFNEQNISNELINGSRCNKKLTDKMVINSVKNT